MRNLFPFFLTLHSSSESLIFFNNNQVSPWPSQLPVLYHLSAVPPELSLWWLLQTLPHKAFGCPYVYQSAQAAITKHQRLGGFNNRHFFTSQFWGLKVQDERDGSLITPKVSLLGFQMAGFLLHPPMAFFSVHVYPRCLSLFLRGHHPYQIRSPPQWPHVKFIAS